jgi:CheY-like chemotaxis protein
MNEGGRTASGFKPKTRPLVLLVEEHDDTRELYAEYLARFGFSVLEARDGAEAIDKALGFHPVAAVLDLSLPDIDAFRVVRRMRADERTSGILIIGLNPHAGPTWPVLARNAGCDAVLPKPCLPSNLLSQLMKMLAQRATGEGTPGAQSST